jgi:hypothetical protein
MRSRHSVPHDENSPQLPDEVLRSWLMRFSAAATVLSFSLSYKFSLLIQLLVVVWMICSHIIAVDDGVGVVQQQHLVILLYSCISAAGSGVRRAMVAQQSAPRTATYVSNVLVCCESNAVFIRT